MWKEFWLQKTLFLPWPKINIIFLYIPEIRIELAHYVHTVAPWITPRITPGKGKERFANGHQESVEMVLVITVRWLLQSHMHNVSETSQKMAHFTKSKGSVWLECRVYISKLDEESWGYFLICIPRWQACCDGLEFDTGIMRYQVRNTSFGDIQEIIKSPEYRARYFETTQ